MRRSKSSIVGQTTAICACSLLVVLTIAVAAPAADGGGMQGSTKSRQGAFLPRPPYPEAVRAQRMQGRVMVRVAFTSEGAVAKVLLLKSSGHQILDDYTVEYIKKRWQGAPGGPAAKTFYLDYSLH